MIKKTKPSHAACACGAAAVQLRFGSGGPARSRRDGFSLLELMIAIVILGLGLVMVATTYPIGWQRAVRLADYTRQISVIEAAHTSAWDSTRLFTLKSTNVVWCCPMSTHARVRRKTD
ncbi:MAG: prepilin-type N-terminal cleavage/methylation domain-containing protein [Chloroflexi bacterium]|nr:prepilin-type N-terminal cleavage/methylation domain-containing protein [Chloroflexota bacterium]